MTIYVDVDAIMVLFCSPTISREVTKAFWLVPCGSEMVAKRSAFLKFYPSLWAPPLTMEKLIYSKRFLMQIQKRIRDNILFELFKPHYHINQKMNRLSCVALPIQNNNNNNNNKLL